MNNYYYVLGSVLDPGGSYINQVMNLIFQVLIVNKRRQIGRQVSAISYEGHNDRNMMKQWRLKGENG